ncbi:MAG: hypothetical protein PHW37_03170 [Acholeplasmataceae bacterium]|jgi:hypothetical protein|nr:hypothetical protein [Acholeplasmataceae bacterium]MDD4194251.1 hypothetical protein [Acholeplasmataceae bacterium]MDY0338539.1 hypothetical protein [Acholeplasmataceae bacterium]
MSKDNLKEERMKVLDLLSKGIISADEAEKLLSAMDKSEEGLKAEAVLVDQKKAPFRMLKILVDSEDGDKVRVQIPVEFAKLLKTGKFNVNLSDNDIDIDALLDMINTGVVGEIVSVDSADGDKIRIIVE